MKTKMICLLLLLSLSSFFTGCGQNSAENSSVSPPVIETDRSENGANTEQTSSTQAAVGSSSTDSKKDSESTTDGTAAYHNAQTSSGQSGGKQTGSSSGGSTSSGGGTTHSTPSSQSSSTTPSKPDSSSSSKPDSSSSSTKPTVPDYLQPYVYPFDIPAIKADLIAYGEGLGMTHYTHHPNGSLRTPDNCSWWNPYPLTVDCKDPERTRRQLQERVKFDMDDLGLVDFTIYIETGPNNQYAVYMMH